MEAVIAKRTEKNLQEAVQSLKNELEKEGYGVLFELNFKDTLNQEGVEFERNFIALDVCDAGRAKELLNTNIEAGYFLPCKVVVYEDGDHVCIGVPQLSAQYGLAGLSELDAVAKKIEESLKKVIENAA